MLYSDGGDESFVSEIEGPIFKKEYKVNALHFLEMKEDDPAGLRKRIEYANNSSETFLSSRHLLSYFFTGVLW